MNEMLERLVTEIIIRAIKDARGDMTGVYDKYNREVSRAQNVASAKRWLCGQQCATWCDHIGVDFEWLQKGVSGL